MKKILLISALCLGLISANAQISLKGSKFYDNMSITLKGAAVQNFDGPHGYYKGLYGDAAGTTGDFGWHNGFWKNMRANAGVEIRKQITPCFGLGIEGNAYFNKRGTAFCGPKNVVDMIYAGAFGAFNLSNIFGGYKGAPRFFEIEAVYGAGWMHAFTPPSQCGDRNFVTNIDWFKQGQFLGDRIFRANYGKFNAIDEASDNLFASKAGLNLNFNLGEAKAWTVSLKPAVLWYVKSPLPKYNSQQALLELGAGITYHFKNSNGTHHFVEVRPYDQAEVDGLNAQINDLRAQLAKVKADLDDCLAREPQTKEVIKYVDKVVYKDNTGSVRYVHFKQGKSVVTADQLPNVQQVAAYLNSHPEAKVDIKGYASPEGTKEINDRLSKERAAAVKNLLVNKYKVAADRISTQGCGVGDVFEQPEWNRVSICTIDKAQ